METGSTIVGFVNSPKRELTNDQERIGRCIKLAREEGGLSQAELSGQVGFRDRQTLAAIEAGERKVSANELIAFMDILHKDLDFFTDPMLLLDEAKFSWRAPEASPAFLDDFEKKAGRWIGSFRHLREANRSEFDPIVPTLGLDVRSSYEDAREAAEKLVHSWGIKSIPAEEIPEKVENVLNVLVLWVEAPEAISGAACRLPEFNTILINRREPEGRRNFDFAHELFHVLTWSRMPPQRLDPTEIGKGKGKVKRIEDLANNFASALLLPRCWLEPKWRDRDERQDIHDWINLTADEFRVTAKALFWRLVHLEWLSRGDQLDINPNRLTWNGRPSGEATLPALFSKKFVEEVWKALDKGRVSVRRMARDLNLSIDELADLLSDHGFEPPFDL